MGAILVTAMKVLTRMT